MILAGEERSGDQAPMSSESHSPPTEPPLHIASFGTSSSPHPHLHTHTDNTRKGLPHEAELGLLRTSHKSLLSCHDQTSFEGMSMTMSFPTRSWCFCRLNDLTMSTASSLTGIRKKRSARAMLRSFNQQNGGGLRLPQGPRVTMSFKVISSSSG